MTDETPQIRKLHAKYCALSGRNIECSLAEMFRWRTWQAHGWTEADLELVINHINSLIKAGRRWPESLRLYNLLEESRFLEDVTDARALARTPKVDKGKASVLAATGRPSEPEQPPARSARQVMEANAALDELLRLRDSL